MSENKFCGVSEQGASGILWGVFEGAPLSGRRVASFVDQQEAYDYQEFRNGHINNMADIGEIQEIYKERDLKASRLHSELSTITADRNALKETLKSALALLEHSRIALDRILKRDKWLSFHNSDHAECEACNDNNFAQKRLEEITQFLAAKKEI